MENAGHGREGGRFGRSGAAGRRGWREGAGRKGFGRTGGARAAGRLRPPGGRAGISAIHLGLILLVLLLAAGAGRAALVFNPNAGLPNGPVRQEAAVEAAVDLGCSNGPPNCVFPVTLRLEWQDAASGATYQTASQTFGALQPNGVIGQMTDTFRCNSHPNKNNAAPCLPLLPGNPPSRNVRLQATASDSSLPQPQVSASRWTVTVVKGENDPASATITAPDKYDIDAVAPIEFDIAAGDGDDEVRLLALNVRIEEAGSSGTRMLADWNSETGGGAGLQAGPPRMGPYGPRYYFRLDCQLLQCKDYLHIEAMALDPHEQQPGGLDPNKEASKAVIALNGPQGGTDTLLPPIPSVQPSPPHNAEPMSLSALQPDPSGPNTRLKVTHHEYTYKSDDGRTLMVSRQPVSKSKVRGKSFVESSDSFTCNENDCPADKPLHLEMVAIGTDAQGLAARSAVGAALIRFYQAPPDAPVLLSVEPDDGRSSRLEQLKARHPLLLETKTDALRLQFGPAPGKSLEAYRYSIFKDGHGVSSERDRTDGTVAIDCRALGCEEGTVLGLDVWGRKGGRDSEKKSYLFSVKVTRVPGATLAACGQPAGCVWKWTSILGVGLMAMALVLVLAYMLGEALAMPRLLDWAKTEALQLVLSLLLFVLILWLVNTECSLKMGWLLRWSGLGGDVVTGSMTPMEAGQAYLAWGAEQTHETVAFLRRDMGALNMRATYNTFESQMLIGNNGYSLSTWSGDWTVLGTMGMMLNLNTGFVIALLLQLFSLQFFASACGLFALFVPIGLLLRSVPFMRGVGGSLVAIGVGFYIFYPMILAMLGLMLPPLYHGAYGAYWDNWSVEQINADEFSLTGKSIADYINTYPAMRVRPDPGGDDADHRDEPVDLAVYFGMSAMNFVRAILLPSAGLVVAVSFVRDLSALFGEEVDAGRLIQMV